MHNFVEKLKISIRIVTPKGVLLPALCNARATLEGLLSKLKRTPPTPPQKKLM